MTVTAELPLTMLNCANDMASKRQAEERESDVQTYQLKFPFQLYDMLEDSAEKDFEDVIAWLPCGTGFQILDQQRFQDKVLPTYFGMKKYRSFQRQLHWYSFERVTVGRLNESAFLHRFFNRGQRDKCQFVARKKKASTSRSSKVKAGSIGDRKDKMGLIPKVYSGLLAKRAHSDSNQSPILDSFLPNELSADVIRTGDLSSTDYSADSNWTFGAQEVLDNAVIATSQLTSDSFSNSSLGNNRAKSKQEVGGPIAWNAFIPSNNTLDFDGQSESDATKLEGHWWYTQGDILLGFGHQVVDLYYPDEKQASSESGKTAYAPSDIINEVICTLKR